MSNVKHEAKSMCSTYDIDLPCDECSCGVKEEETAKKLTSTMTNAEQRKLQQQQAREVDEKYKTIFGDEKPTDYDGDDEAEKLRRKPYTLPEGSSLVIDEEESYNKAGCGTGDTTTNSGGGGGGGHALITAARNNNGQMNRILSSSTNTTQSVSRRNNTDLNEKDGGALNSTNSVPYFAPYNFSVPTTIIHHRPQQQQFSFSSNNNILNPTNDNNNYRLVRQNLTPQRYTPFQSPRRMMNSAFFSAGNPMENVTKSQQQVILNSGSKTPVLSALLNPNVNSLPASNVFHSAAASIIPPQTPAAAASNLFQNESWLSAYCNLLNYAQQQQNLAAAAAAQPAVSLSGGTQQALPFISNFYQHSPLPTMYQQQQQHQQHILQQQQQQQQYQQQLLVEQQQRDNFSAIYQQMLLQQQQQQQQQNPFYLANYGSNNYGSFNQQSAQMCLPSTTLSAVMDGKQKTPSGENSGGFNNMIPVSAIASAAFQPEQQQQEQQQQVSSPSAMLSPPSISDSPQVKDAASSTLNASSLQSASTTPSTSLQSSSPSVDQQQKPPGQRRSSAALPRHATEYLRKWFDEHCNNPYPTRDERNILGSVTNLSFQQVTAWFANARRRQKNVENSLAAADPPNYYPSQQQNFAPPSQNQHRFSALALSQQPPQENNTSEVDEVLVGSGQVNFGSLAQRRARGHGTGGGGRRRSTQNPTYEAAQAQFMLSAMQLGRKSNLWQEDYSAMQPSSSTTPNNSSLHMLANAAAAVDANSSSDDAYYSTQRQI